MLFSQLLAIAAAPLLAYAAIFPADTKVKMLTGKTFAQALKQNKTMAVAFVAPWCGHCQKMAPEWSKAAKGLHPLIPMYAVDCDIEGNKRLCSEQGIKGFPTVKGWARGQKSPPHDYNDERVAGKIFKWISELVPSKVETKTKLSDITSWAAKNSKKPRALLITKDTKIPLMWQVLSNRYRDSIVFAIHRDETTPGKLGIGELNAAKVLIYPAGEAKEFSLYDGVTKYNDVSRWMKGIVEGTIVPELFGAEKADDGLKDEL